MDFSLWRKDPVANIVIWKCGEKSCGEKSRGEKSYGEMTVASFVWRNGREPVKESVSHHIRLVYLIRELAYLIYVF